MTDREEGPQEQVEVRNRKFGSISYALGLAAIVGSFALPTANKPLRELRAGLDVAGLALMVKGYTQGLKARERLDRLEEDEHRQP